MAARVTGSISSFIARHFGPMGLWSATLSKSSTPCSVHTKSPCPSHLQVCNEPPSIRIDRIYTDEGSRKLPKCLVFQRKSLVGDFCKRNLSDATLPDKLLQLSFPVS